MARVSLSSGAEVVAAAEFAAWWEEQRARREEGAAQLTRGDFLGLLNGPARSRPFLTGTFWGFGVFYQNRLHTKGYPYSNLSTSTGGHRLGS